MLSRWCRRICTEKFCSTSLETYSLMITLSSLAKENREDQLRKWMNKRMNKCADYFSSLREKKIVYSVCSFKPLFGNVFFIFIPMWIETIFQATQWIRQIVLKLFKYKLYTPTIIIEVRRDNFRRYIRKILPMLCVFLP